MTHHRPSKAPVRPSDGPNPIGESRAEPGAPAEAHTGAQKLRLDQMNDDLLEALYDERDQLRAWLERGIDQHMAFGLIRPDGTDEQFPCADWCYACRLDRAEAERDMLGRESDRLRRDWVAMRARAETAEAARDQHADILREYIQLADVTHAYRIQGGHDSLGENLSCAGCALRDKARTALAAQLQDGPTSGADDATGA